MYGLLQASGKYSYTNAVTNAKDSLRSYCTLERNVSGKGGKAAIIHPFSEALNSLFPLHLKY